VDFDAEYKKALTRHILAAEALNKEDRYLEGPWSSFCGLDAIGPRRNFRVIQAQVKRLDESRELLWRFDPSQARADEIHFEEVRALVEEQEEADKRVVAGVAKLKSHRRTPTWPVHGQFMVLCWCAGCQDMNRGQVGEESYVPPQ